jgi:hypothetical protein
VSVEELPFPVIDATRLECQAYYWQSSGQDEIVRFSREVRHVAAQLRRFAINSRTLGTRS